MQEPRPIARGRSQDEVLEVIPVPDPKELLARDHTLNGAILFGLDGHVIEIQARAMEVLRRPLHFGAATRISGIACGAVTEALDRISGAFAKLGISESPVEILVNLVPPDLLKQGTSLDLPLAIILLQAAGVLPHLPEHRQGDYLLIGELGIHGEIHRVPGALSLAFTARPGQKLIVPSGNEKECSLILAKHGHQTCAVFPVALLEEVVDFFRGKRKLDSSLKGGNMRFENAVPKSPDLGMIRGQHRAREAAWIAAAGGHNDTRR